MRVSMIHTLTAIRHQHRIYRCQLQFNRFYSSIIIIEYRFHLLDTAAVVGHRHRWNKYLHTAIVKISRKNRRILTLPRQRFSRLLTVADRRLDRILIPVCGIAEIKDRRQCVMHHLHLSQRDIDTTTALLVIFIFCYQTVIILLLHHPLHRPPLYLPSNSAPLSSPGHAPAHSPLSTPTAPASHAIHSNLPRLLPDKSYHNFQDRIHPSSRKELRY